MSKIAIVVLADTAGGEGLGRIVNALTAAKEFQEAGDELSVSFSGAGTKWIGELNRPEHQLNAAFRSLQPHIAGACRFCAGAFGVADDVEAAGVGLIDDYGANMSYRRLIQDGYHVLTF